MGDFLLSASRDKMVRLWEVSTGFCKKTYVGHEDWVEILKYIIVVRLDAVILVLMESNLPPHRRIKKYLFGTQIVLKLLPS